VYKSEQEKNRGQDFTTQYNYTNRVRLSNYTSSSGKFPVV